MKHFNHMTDDELKDHVRQLKGQFETAQKHMHQRELKRLRAKNKPLPPANMRPHTVATTLAECVPTGFKVAPKGQSL